MHHNRLNTDPVHITYRLDGSIPQAKLTLLKDGYKVAKVKLGKRFPFKAQKPDSPLYKSFRSAADKLEESHFGMYEQLVHDRSEGPKFLPNPASQKIIIDSWKYIAKTLNISIYIVWVMSNHVHVILRGNQKDCDIDLEELMSSHKKFTATQINKTDNKKGRRVWAKDFFDRDIRKGSFTTVFWYILKNPVLVGIVNNPFEYKGTWFDTRMEQEYVTPYRRNWS